MKLLLRIKSVINIGSTQVNMMSNGHLPSLPNVETFLDIKGLSMIPFFWYPPPFAFPPIFNKSNKKITNVRIIKLVIKIQKSPS